jgi:hypothetical protein
VQVHLVLFNIKEQLVTSRLCQFEILRLTLFTIAMPMS